MVLLPRLTWQWHLCSLEHILYPSNGQSYSALLCLCGAEAVDTLSTLVQILGKSEGKEGM